MNVLLMHHVIQMQVAPTMLGVIRVHVMKDTREMVSHVHVSNRYSTVWFKINFFKSHISHEWDSIINIYLKIFIYKP